MASHCPDVRQPCQPPAAHLHCPEDRTGTSLSVQPSTRPDQSIYVEPSSPAASSDVPTIFSRNRDASVSSISDASGASDIPPSLTHGGSVPSDSVPTDLASAVTPFPTFDPDTGETLQNGHLADYDCPCHFLPCHRRFQDKEHWLEHSLAHFHPYGPPPGGSKCPLCAWHITPDLLPYQDRAHFDQMLREAYSLDGRQAKKTRVDEIKKERAFRMWMIRQDHVAHHHAQGNSLASLEPDFELMKYLRDKKILSDGAYKRLLGRGPDAYDRPETPEERQERERRIRAEQTPDVTCVTMDASPRERRAQRG